MTRKYPGDAVFEAAPEFSAGAAEYAAEQRLERAKEIAKHQADLTRLASYVCFTTQFNPSDDTWAAIKVYRDGNPIVLDDGFATEDEADQCAELAREAELRPQLNASLQAAE